MGVEKNSYRNLGRLGGIQEALFEGGSNSKHLPDRHRDDNCQIRFFNNLIFLPKMLVNERLLGNETVLCLLPYSPLLT